jgi:hypothetical protein
MATAVPPRCDADHNFCDDSERFRKATGGGLLAFRSHRTGAIRNGLKQSQCFASVPAPSRQSSGRGFEPR